MTHDTNTPTYRAAQLGALLARHYPEAGTHRIAEAVLTMQRAQRLVQRDELSRLNEPVSIGQSREMDERAQSLGRAIAGMLLDVMLRPYRKDSDNPDLESFAPHANPARIALGGDARGPCATLHIPGLRGDGMGEGFPIY